MADKTTRQIAEYSRILTQILSDVFEQNFLSEQTKGLFSKTQFRILKILSVSGPCTVSKIAEMLHISRAAASKNIEKLVRLKLVNRKIMIRDRRAMAVSLTAAGSEDVHRFERWRRRRQYRALAPFTKKQKEELLDLLKMYVHYSLVCEKNIEILCLQCNDDITEICSPGGDKKPCRHDGRKN